MKILTALKILVIVLAVIILVMLGVLFFYSPAKAPEVPPSAPSALVSADGALALATSSLQAGMRVQPPMLLQGTVTGGGWFFEGSFPIKIMDASGTVLGTAIAQAEGDWMSTGTVPWTATLRFSEPHSATGTIVFMNDNPSGIPANQKTLIVPVRFQ